MSLAPPGSPVFDLKSTAWTLTAMRLYTADADALAGALQARFGDTPALFDDDPLVVDVSPLRQADIDVDWPRVIDALRGQRLLPIAVQGGSAAQVATARKAGLSEAMAPEAGGALPQAPQPAPASLAAPEPAVEARVQEPAASQAQHSEPATPALIVDKPLRSGQRVYARGGDLVVLSVVSFGAEVIADGSIHVYGPLRGRAIAGARGDRQARIYSTCLEPQLVSIAGIYRTTETPLDATVAGRPAQVRLEGDRILVEPLAP